MESRALALRLILGLGLVSLFADLTYEGGRSISGPYLALLGAGPLLVGAVSGVGEFLGYLVRFLAGHLVDRTGRVWTFLYLGYGLSLLALPLLALAPGAGMAAALLVLERLGKGFRTPARNALLARAGKEVGQGQAFGLHELLDQVGAFLGPIYVAGLLYLLGGMGQGTAYRLALAALVLPALLALYFLHRARGFEAREPVAQNLSPGGFPRAYYLYLGFAALGVMGFAHFGLVAYHLGQAGLTPALIPLLYALAMGADALWAYGAGLLYDRIGFKVLLGYPFLAFFGTALFFLGKGLEALLLAAVLWGGAMGVQESVMRSAVAGLAPEARRGTAYGLFDAVYGGGWMLGSLAMGFLYAFAPVYPVLLSLVLGLGAFLLLRPLLK